MVSVRESHAVEVFSGPFQHIPFEVSCMYWLDVTPRFILDMASYIINEQSVRFNILSNIRNNRGILPNKVYSSL